MPEYKVDRKDSKPMDAKQKKPVIEIFVPTESLSLHSNSPVWPKFEGLCQINIFTLDDLQFHTRESIDNLDFMLIFSNSIELISSILSQKNLFNKLIMVGTSLEVSEYKYLKNLGMLDYIHEQTLEEDLSALLQSQLADISTGGAGQVIALTSACETFNVSDVCLFLASNSSHNLERPAVILDLNVFHSYIASKLDLPVEGGLGQLLLASEDIAAELDDALIKADQGYWVLYDTLDPEQIDDRFELTISQILIYLRLRFSTVFVTIPAARPEINASLNHIIDRLVVVTSDSVASVKSNILYAKNLNRGDFKTENFDAIAMVSSNSLPSKIVFEYLKKSAITANVFFLEKRNNILQKLFKHNDNNIDGLQSFVGQVATHALAKFLSTDSESSATSLSPEKSPLMLRTRKFTSDDKAVTALEFSLLIPVMVSALVVTYAISAAQLDRARFSLYQSELKRYLDSSRSIDNLLLFHNSMLNQVNDEFKFSRLGDLTLIEKCSCDSITDLNVKYSCVQGSCEPGDLRVSQITLNLPLNVDFSSIPILKDLDVSYASSVFGADL